MSDELSTAATEQTGLRSLAVRIWRGALRNKGLVAAVILTATFEACFTKAPFLLVSPLLQALEGTEAVAPREPGAGPPPEEGFWYPGPTEVPATQPDTGLADRVQSRIKRELVWLGGGVASGLGLEFEGSELDRQRKEVISACAFLVGVAALLGAVAIYFSLFLSRYFATRIVVDLRNEVADHILRLPLRFFGRRRIGDLISNLTNDTTVLSRSFMLVADHAVADPMLIVGNIAVVTLVAPEVLWVFVPAIPLMALPMIRLGRKVRKRSSRTLAAMGDSTESMNQMLTGIKTVKAFQLEDQRIEDFRRINEEYMHRTKRMLQTKGRSQAFVFIGYQCAFIGMLLVLGWLVLSGYKDVPDIAAIMVPVSTTYTHVKRLSRAYNTMMESLGALERIEAVLLESPDQSRLGSVEVTGLRGEVVVDRVSFAYGDETVLHDVSFRVEPGTMVALVGPSGAGKSTLVDLLARFFDPVSGRILIDGKDLRELDLTSYRRRVAMVSQQPFLFNASILDNIRCGRPDASLEEVEAAAQAAQIHDFIAALPEGYGTIAGERGSRLSGGQMQRITIARAMLRDPAILFLDEATSALDSESEGAVQRALANLMEGRTSFVIAHRLATIRDADLIIVMREGRIVEQGGHDELLKHEGLYRRLVELQDVG